jgi:hypothetical protein
MAAPKRAAAGRADFRDRTAASILRGDRLRGKREAEHTFPCKSRSSTSAGVAKSGSLLRFDSSVGTITLVVKTDTLITINVGCCTVNDDASESMPGSCQGSAIVRS